jgi:hypothetical protein
MTAETREHLFPAGTLHGLFERQGHAYDGWRAFLVDALMQDFEHTEASASPTERMDALLDRVRPLIGDDLTMETELLVFEYARTLADHAVPLAYALGRTAPAGLDGMDDWLDRAKALLTERQASAVDDLASWMARHTSLDDADARAAAESVLRRISVEA